MTMNDAPPPPPPQFKDRPRVRATGWKRWLPLLLLAAVILAFLLLASQCTDDDDARNQPTYQGAEPGDSPPASTPPTLPK